jgi:hypothetical protein
MLGGGILYALTFPWVAKHILPVADIGKLTRTQLLDLPVPAVLGMVAGRAIGVFALVHRVEASRRRD